MNGNGLAYRGFLKHSEIPLGESKQDVTHDKLATQIIKLAQRIGQQPLVDCAPSRDASYLQALITARKTRQKLFGSDLFGEPAWDMLLDLTVTMIEQRFVSVSSLCIAAGVPTSTAIRYIKAMVDDGLVERREDPEDARRTYVVLKPETFEKMMMYLASGKKMFMHLAITA